MMMAAREAAGMKWNPPLTTPRASNTTPPVGNYEGTYYPHNIKQLLVKERNVLEEPQNIPHAIFQGSRVSMSNHVH